ncbi:MAG: hypothetical protein AAF268_16895 [Cyanobacteria bacterium P01_A01_bin.3]
MDAERFGKLPPRYTFAINPSQEVRYSKCPKCERATYPRKFPLLILINQSDPLILGKTCRYCSKCEFIIAHQDELEAALAEVVAQRDPAALGNDYFVLATVEKKAWRKGLENAQTIDDIRVHTADIKTYVELEYEPARWVQSDES